MPLTGPDQVGSRSGGVGKWGHLDRAGNAAEWVLDVPGNMPVPCTDCANLGSPSDTTRETPGGAWFTGFADPNVSEVDLKNTRPNLQTAAEA